MKKTVLVIKITRLSQCLTNPRPKGCKIKRKKEKFRKGVVGSRKKRQKNFLQFHIDCWKKAWTTRTLDRATFKK